MQETLMTKKELLQKLAIIKFFGFKLKPYSLGITINYLNFKKDKDEWYLHENEKNLIAFLDYVRDGNIIAGKYLAEKDILAHTIAKAIIDYSHENRTYLELLSPEAFLFLEYLNTKDEKILNKIYILKNGEVIYSYLDFIVNDCPAAKTHLFNKTFTIFAFAEGLIHNEKKAINYLLGK